MKAQDSAFLARALRERIYATIATLVSLITLADHLDAEPSSRITIPLWITLFGLWSASMFADTAAHLASHGALPARHEVREMVRVTGQILACGVLPTVLFLMSGAGLFGLDRALDLAILGQIGTLAVFAWLAVRKATIPMVWKTVIIVAEVGLGLLVVGLELAAHWI